MYLVIKNFNFRNCCIVLIFANNAPENETCINYNPHFKLVCSVLPSVFCYRFLQITIIEVT